MNKKPIVCHYTHLVSEIRSYSSTDGYLNKDDYLAIVNVVWESDRKVILRGANGKICRGTLLACFTILWNLGAELISLTRAAKRRMPFGTVVEYGEKENRWEIDLTTLKEINLI